MAKLNKNLFIRVDAGIKTGTGHIMRCLTLADSLKKSFDGTFVVSNQMPSNLSRLIREKGYKTYFIRGYTHIEGKKLQIKQKKAIENDVNQCTKIINLYKNAENWLLIDHYGVDYKWETKIRNHVEKIIVIDDLANRKHECDVLIDQNFYRNMKKRYAKLVPKKCLQLLGPKFALLRPEFKNATKRLKRKYKIRRILISFGGSDPSNQTAKVLRAIKILDSVYNIDVVAGNSNPHKKSIRNLCSNIPYASFYYHTKNMAKIMAKADLAIGGGGSTTWERCCMGLPAIVSVLSENQRQLTKEVARIGCVINLGQAAYVRPKDYAVAIRTMDSKTLQNMSKKCMRLVDGNGAGRVASKIFQIE